MMGYKDQTWCSSPNCQNKCGRQFTDLDRRAAIKWWGGEDFPIVTMQCCDENGELKQPGA